jgi:hypothetical protein
VSFGIMLKFCGEFLAPSPISKLEDHPLLAVRNFLLCTTYIHSFLPHLGAVSLSALRARAVLYHVTPLTLPTFTIILNYRLFQEENIIYSYDVGIKVKESAPLSVFEITFISFCSYIRRNRVA